MYFSYSGLLVVLDCLVWGGVIIYHFRYYARGIKTCQKYWELGNNMPLFHKTPQEYICSHTAGYCAANHFALQCVDTGRFCLRSIQTRSQ